MTIPPINEDTLMFMVPIGAGLLVVFLLFVIFLSLKRKKDKELKKAKKSTKKKSSAKIGQATVLAGEASNKAVIGSTNSESELERGIEKVSDAPPGVSPRAHDAITPSYTADAWATRWSKPTFASFSDGALSLPPAEHALSEPSSAKPGEVWECEYRAAPLGVPSNGGETNFYVGPVVRDAKGNLLSWWKEQPAFKSGESFRVGKVAVTVPQQGATVHIGVLGSFYEPPRIAGNVPVTFSDLCLRRTHKVEP